MENNNKNNIIESIGLLTLAQYRSITDPAVKVSEKMINFGDKKFLEPSMFFECAEGFSYALDYIFPNSKEVLVVNGEKEIRLKQSMPYIGIRPVIQLSKDYKALDFPFAGATHDCTRIVSLFDLEWYVLDEKHLLLKDIAFLSRMHINDSETVLSIEDMEVNNLLQTFASFLEAVKGEEGEEVLIV